MIASANIAFDSEKLSSPIGKLVADMYTKDPKVFNRGKISVWAAALIYAVAKENCIHFSDTDNPITLDRIADFFEDNKRTIGNKASKIYNEMGMSQFAPKYRIWMDNDTYTEVEEEDFITLIAVIELSWPKEKINELWEQFTDEFFVDELGYYEILADEIDDNKMTLTFEVADFFADEFIGRLDFIGEVIEVYEDTSNKNDFLPMEHYETFMRYHTSMNLDDKEFDSIEELNNYMQQFQNIPIDELPNHIPQNPVEQAEIQALDAYKLPKEESLIAIEKIITDYPNTVEAYVCKAGWEIDPENQLDILYEALEAGERKLDLDELNTEKMWWKFHHTRPYMRALNVLAIQLFRMDYIKESIEVIEDLLHKNPDDNQGIRYFAIQVFVEKGKWVKLKNLFQLFADEESIEFDLARMAYNYYKGKTKSRAKHNLEKLLIESPTLQAMCRHIDVPDSQEDEFVMAILEQLMSKDKKFTKWFSITLFEAYEKVFGFDHGQEAKVIPIDFINPN
jgi:tetratricopeptide (TPR) repeat protein